jgi:hypothetical protein
MGAVVHSQLPVCSTPRRSMRSLDRDTRTYSSDPVRVTDRRNSARVGWSLEGVEILSLLHKHALETAWDYQPDGSDRLVPKIGEGMGDITREPHDKCQPLRQISRRRRRRLTRPR